MIRIAAIGLVVVFSGVACSSGSAGGEQGATGGTGAQGGGAGQGAAAGSGGTGGIASGGGGSSGGGVGGLGGTAGAGGGASGGATSVTWQVIENSSVYGVKAITGHPTEPNTIAAVFDKMSLKPGAPTTVAVALSKDSGKTLTFTHVMDIPKNSNVDSNGLVWHPTDASKIAFAFNFPYGFDYKDLWRLGRSSDGGQSFSVSSIVKLYGLVWTDGLAASVDGSFKVSTDFGASFVSPTSQPPGCTTPQAYAKSASVEVFACGKTGLFNCVAGKCQASTGPSNIEVRRVVSVPSDAKRFVALGVAGAKFQILLSVDAGVSFTAAQELPAGNWKLLVDYRPKGKVLALLNSAASKYDVWRSLDAGSSFADVTPPANLKNSKGLSTYAYEIGLTAGGSIVAYTAAGWLRLDP